VFPAVTSGGSDGSLTGSDDLWNGGDDLPEVGVVLLGPRAMTPRSVDSCSAIDRDLGAFDNCQPVRVRLQRP
jgi:hypothetical protein